MSSKSAAVPTPLAKVKGKVAFITGGSSGIGLGIARVLSAAGMKVVFTYRNAAHRDAALASFPKDNPGVHAIALDTADRDDMVRAADEAERVFGHVHLLCNNAGVGLPALLSKASWQDWDWMMDVNVNGVFSGIRTFLPRMQAHADGGHIMVTSSAAGLVASALGVYGTTKFAVVGMMEALREELAGGNVGVSIFCPGLVRTEIFNAERNRPVGHGVAPAQAHAAPPLRPGAPPVDLMAVAMDPLEAGRQVLEGLRRNDLYILTHPEFAPAVKQRNALLMASFSNKPVPAARRQATDVFTPRIYSVELAKKKAAAKQKPAAKTKTAGGIARRVSAKKTATAARRPAKARRR
jgi:NAD(P)-dependent dehydrogenase (short-subunit alcohol dehydrogenase family)